MHDPSSPAHPVIGRATWTRRTLVRAAGALAAVPWVPADAAGDFWSLARAGGALLLRHARTEPGVGDPPGMRLDDCRTQRNLSADGRAQAARLAEHAAQEGLRLDRILSSAWCRCRDTARAFERLGPPHEVWTPLNSFFQGQGDEARQTAAVREGLRALPAGQVWLLVTHQVNVTALTGSGVAMGEMLLVHPQPAAPWPVVGRWAG